MNARLFLYSNENEWILAQVNALKAAIEQALEKGRTNFHACLSGGKTPEPVYKALAADASLAAFARRLELHFWVGDERDLPPGHEDRNETMLRRSLAGILGLAHFHAWPSGGGESASRGYGGEILALLGTKPVFDFTYLGMGADGHTAGIFTLSDARASSGPFAHPSESPSYPKERMTLAAWVLRNSAVISVGLRGRDKKEALEAALAGSRLSPIGLIAGEKGSFHFLDTEERA
jgi:6-phosphogluconolactonase